jgi:hypothetical protein
LEFSNYFNVNMSLLRMYDNDRFWSYLAFRFSKC